ncbi:MAG TPA: DNA polymerase ligase N-terminal domain-containing protein [Streptosporangiaceae bacterium]|jgi:bifunctional non-homologous end joining protein LigD
MPAPGKERGTGARRLAPYQRMRDFTRTPEPAGAPPGQDQGGPLRFVVQRHRARRLHYDLRFEIDGVLVSWAVPKGPTLDPKARRAAIHVEDHPIEYLDFEGVIPAREYGGGDVIVWDQGSWEPHGTDDPAAAVAAGELHADLRGHKLRGRLVLVRRGDQSGQDQWLLLHKNDEWAVSGWDPEDYPASVLSGRTNDEVKAAPDREWRSGLPPAQASVAVGSATGAAPASATELAALDALGAGGSWEVFGRKLRVTNLDKVLFPGRPGQPPVTKREFIRYAAYIAPVLLPYLSGRPLNMHRFPGGADAGGFWHKQLPGHAPGWLPRWDDPAAGPGKTSTYLVVDEPAALVWAANFGALEWHAWTARAAAPREPSYALIDIDPGSATRWEDVLVLARLHRAALEHLGVRAQPKLTGRRGIQIWVPVAPGLSYQQTRGWVEQLSKAVGAVVPDLISWDWDVRARGGRARLDYTQNVSNKTLVAPYSPRPAPGAPVSAPIDWAELDDPSLRPDSFTIRAVAGRLARRGDLFQAVLGDGQQLPPVR